MQGCKNPLTGLSSGAMTESLHEYVLSELQSHKGNWQRVSTGSGVPLRTLEKIARKEIQDPGIKSIEKLANYFRSYEAA